MSKYHKSKFPVIEHIDDVLPHIEGRKEFIVIDKGWYVVIDYVLQTDDTFLGEHSSVRRECRGLKFHSNTGVILARPLEKFFNVGEREETSLESIGNQKPRSVYLKMDGSMVHGVVNHDGEVELMTRKGRTEIAKAAEKALSDEHKSFIYHSHAMGYTATFEYTSPTNRIVVPYEDSSVTLLALRDKETGVYQLPLEKTFMFNKGWEDNIPIVSALECGETVSDVVKTIKDWDKDEGVVIVLQDKSRVKVKADYYVLRHKAKDNLSREKEVLELVVNHQEDDLIPLLDSEGAKALKGYANDVRNNLAEAIKRLESLVREAKESGADRKEFAVDWVKRLDPGYQAAAFMVYSGKSADDAILGFIKSSLVTRKGLDKVRDLVGNVAWNDYYSFWGE